MDRSAVIWMILAVAGLWVLGPTAEWGKYLGFSGILLAAARRDVRTWEIPDYFHGMALVWWLIFLPFTEDGWKAGLVSGLLGGSLVAGGLFALVCLADRIYGRETMGGGDIKLFFVTGMYLGAARNLLTVILSCIFGILFAVASGKRKIPFGPAIAAAAICSCLVGDRIVFWYLSLFESGM